MRSCIMPGLPTHLVQELNVATVSVGFDHPYSIIFEISFEELCSKLLDCVCYSRYKLVKSP